MGHSFVVGTMIITYFIGNTSLIFGNPAQFARHNGRKNDAVFGSADGATATLLKSGSFVRGILTGQSENTVRRQALSNRGCRDKHCLSGIRLRMQFAAGKSSPVATFEKPAFIGRRPDCPAGRWFAAQTRTSNACPYGAGEVPNAEDLAMNKRLKNGIPTPLRCGRSFSPSEDRFPGGNPYTHHSRGNFYG